MPGLESAASAVFAEPCVRACPPPRNLQLWSVRSPIYVAQRFMWRSPREVRKDVLFGRAQAPHDFLIRDYEGTP